MLDSSKVWLLLATLPWLSGARVHRAALRALDREDWETADQLCDRAAVRYRQELACEALARLRVHQQIAAARAGRHRGETAELEIERALARLDRIESLSPPHGLVDAHALMGRWARQVEVVDSKAGASDLPLAA
jgi:hypothetical protein